LARATTHDAIEEYVEAIKDWDSAIALSPVVEQGALRASRASSRVHAGRIAEAVADVAELMKDEGWEADQWYDFACVYAVASGTIADKKQEYADRAMELLRKAVLTGYKNAAHLGKQRDLNSLRGRDDFKKLLAELEASNK
jgi:tetratricopeptide (TPR) repeat protein